MKKVLAVVIPALLVSGTTGAAELYNKNSNKIDIYGNLDARHVFSSDKSSAGDATQGSIGFKGETQISNQLTGYAQWRYKFHANQAESVSSGDHTELGFAGVKYDNLGSLDYGRNYGVLYDVEGITDVLPVFGGNTSAQTDNFMTQRANNLLTYRNDGFFGLVDGLNIALQYQGKNGGMINGKNQTANARELKEQNGDGYGASVSYDLGQGMSVLAAYTSSDRTLNQRSKSDGIRTVVDGSKAESWATGVKYDANDLYLAAMYSETKNMTPYGATKIGSTEAGIASKTQNVEMVAQYQFDFGLRPSIAYLQSRGKGLNWSGSESSSNHDLVKYIDLASYYYFNKNMTAYVDYKINLIDKDKFTQATGVGSANSIGVGLNYQF